MRLIKKAYIWFFGIIKGGYIYGNNYEGYDNRRYLKSR